MATYAIAGENFTSQTAVAARVRSLCDATPLRSALVGQDGAFMLELLTRHPDAEQKLGCGISHIEVRQSPVFRSREFWLCRLDGTETDFSYRKCIRPPPPLRDFTLAARFEIFEQVVALKRLAFFGKQFLTCPVTNAQIDWANCHMDHAAPTFAQLVTAFFPDPASVKTTGHGADGSTTRAFVDRTLAASWQTYHARYAQLRAVSVHANLVVLPRLARGL